MLAFNRGDQKRVHGDRREEVVFSLLFLICAVLIAVEEGPLNTNALLWCALNIAFVMPWSGQFLAAMKSLFVRPPAIAKT